MSRDPRAEWGGAPYVTDHLEWEDGANDRLAALLPQLEAADALAAVINDYLGAYVTGDDQIRLDQAHAAYLAARDAHLTKRTAP